MRRQRRKGAVELPLTLEHVRMPNRYYCVLCVYVRQCCRQKTRVMNELAPNPEDIGEAFKAMPIIVAETAIPLQSNDQNATESCAA